MLPHMKERALLWKVPTKSMWYDIMKIMMGKNHVRGDVELAGDENASIAMEKLKYKCFWRPDAQIVVKNGQIDKCENRQECD